MIFVGADSIEYMDLDNGEDYVLKKDGKTLIIKARHNSVDGGFLAIEAR